MDAQFLDHYNRELGYLRELGGEFAAEYPAMAGRLGLDSFSCADPYVERLLEGFAFLAARVHRQLDAEFPRLTRGLLDTIYPHYNRPVPAAAIVQFQPDADEGSLVDGYRLPRGTRLQGPTSNQSPTPCRFETTQDVDLWPLQITNVELIDRDAVNQRPLPSVIAADPIISNSVRSCLRLTIESTAGIPLSAIKIDQLSMHLRGGEIGHELLELLAARTLAVAVGDSERGQWQRLAASSLKPGGFADEQSLLPGEPRSFSGYRLLQEYFLLPEKFLFVTLSGIREAVSQASGNKIEIVVGLSTSAGDLPSRVSRNHIAMHCAPAINLFKRRADRVQISDTSHEHHLVVDRSRPMDFEIWSIDQLHGHGRSAKQEIEFLPLYAPPNQTASRFDHAAYFSIDRRPRQLSTNQREYGHRSTYLGTETFVSLTDSRQQPSRELIRQLSSTVYCTNRDLSLIKPPGGWADALKLDGPGPVASVHCLTGPTPPRTPIASESGETCWRLVSHLTTNFLSLVDRPVNTDKVADVSTSAAAQLRDMLRLYCPTGVPSANRKVDAIRAVRNTSVTRQLPFDGPIVHGRGVHVEVEMDELAFEGEGVFLLGSVLEQFLARFVTLNSFTETSLQTPSRGTVHRWPVRVGTAPLI